MHQKFIINNKSRLLGVAFIWIARLYEKDNEFTDDLYYLAHESEVSLSTYQWMSIKEEKDIRHALMFVDYICEDFKKAVELSLESDEASLISAFRIIDDCRHRLVEELIKLMRTIRNRKSY